MSCLDALEQEARAASLTIRGAFHPGPEDGAPGCGTLLLLGPDEPRFWARFAESPEHGDGTPHPLDRWSKRVIGDLAARWDGQALFPYDGPPWHPFLRWAEASGRCAPAPVGLLVHDTAGLMVSFRGAVTLPERIDLPVPPATPCPTCAIRPCETACPVGAIAPGKDYDVPACRAHVRSPAGIDCRSEGCLVRRACPVSARIERPAAQAAFHMAAFAPVGDAHA